MTSVKKISSLVQYFIIGVIAWSFYGVIGLNDFNIFDENNLLENTQAFVLLLVFFLFLVPLFEPFRGDKLIAVFFAILTLLLFSFAMGPNHKLLVQTAPGFLWLAIFR